MKTKIIYYLITATLCIVCVIACHKISQQPEKNQQTQATTTNSTIPADHVIGGVPCPECQNYPCVYKEVNNQLDGQQMDMIALGDAYDFGEFLYENDPESTKKESYYHYYLDLSDFAISNNLITTSNLSAWADFLTRGKTCAANY